MRTFKIIIWILLTYLIQNTFGTTFMLCGSAADLILDFLIIYSFYERKESKIFYVMLICAVLNAAGTGREFSVAVLLTGLAAPAAHKLYNYFRMIPGFVRIEIFAFISAFVMYCAENIFSGFADIIGVGIWHAVYTAAVCAVLYPFIRCTLFRNSEKKSFRVQERILDYE